MLNVLERVTSLMFVSTSFSSLVLLSFSMLLSFHGYL
jgi:hypothetical protein